MPKNGSSGGAGAMLDNLKSRLGFAGRDDSYEKDYGKGYDDGFDDDYDDGYDFDDGAGDYGDYDSSYSSRRSRSDRSRDDRSYDDDYAREGAYRPASTGARRRSWSNSNGETFPPLVSIDDVKASTPVPDLYDEPATDDYQPTSRFTPSRTVVDETVPPIDSPAHNASIRDARRSEGYNSLFDSTSPTATIEPASDGYTTRESGYTGNEVFLPIPTRGMTVLKPASYDDVERVAPIVREGNMAVLVMRNTPNELMKRILDFSFGVASALEASVESPGDRVYAIAKGEGLTEDEKRRLRNQGAL